LKAPRIEAEAAVAHDVVTNGAGDDNTRDHGLLDDRNDSLQIDPIGAGLALAMQLWCKARDRKGLRKAMLRILAELEDE
jgi:hypothetical protein